MATTNTMMTMMAMMTLVIQSLTKVSGRLGSACGNPQRHRCREAGESRTKAGFSKLGLVKMFVFARLVCVFFAVCCV